MSIQKNLPNTMRIQEQPFVTTEKVSMELIKDPATLGIYTYLLGKYNDWVIREKELMTRFGKGRDFIRKRLKELREVGLMVTESIRNEKGQIIGWDTMLYRIRPENEQIVTENQITENPPSGKTSDLENPTHTNNRNTFTKEREETTTTKQSSSVISEKIDNQVLDLKLPSDPRSDDAFLEHAKHHIEHNSDKKLSQYQRVKGLLTILKNLKSVNEHFCSKGFIDSETKRLKDEKEKIEAETRMKAQDELHAKRMAQYAASQKQTG